MIRENEIRVDHHTGLPYLTIRQELIDETKEICVVDKNNFGVNLPLYIAIVYNNLLLQINSII